jgi:hypothetical protein
VEGCEHGPLDFQCSLKNLKLTSVGHCTIEDHFEEEKGVLTWRKKLVGGLGFEKMGVHPILC